MPAQAAPQARSRPDHGHIARNAGVALGAVVAGVYFGLTTVAQIDPFYRIPRFDAGKASYTTNGWRGADAVSPPTVRGRAEDQIHGFASRMGFPYPVSFVPRPYPDTPDYSPEPVQADFSGGYREETPVQSATEEVPLEETGCFDCSNDAGLGLDERAEPDSPAPVCGADGHCPADASLVNGGSNPAAISLPEEARPGPA